MNVDPREAIALLRYRIIAEATNPRLTPAERGQLLRELASQAYEHPDGSSWTYASYPQLEGPDIFPSKQRTRSTDTSMHSSATRSTGS